METLRLNFNKVIVVLAQTVKKTELAHGIGYTTTTQLINTLEGKAMLSTKAIVQLVKNFNVSPTFLFTGTGNMFLVKNDEPVFYYGTVTSTIN